MNIKGLEKIKLGELQELFRINTLSVGAAKSILRQFRDTHGLTTDRQALNAFGVAKRVFEE